MFVCLSWTNKRVQITAAINGVQYDKSEPNRAKLQYVSAARISVYFSSVYFVVYKLRKRDQSLDTPNQDVGRPLRCAVLRLVFTLINL